MKQKIFLFLFLISTLIGINIKSSAQCGGFDFNATQFGLTATFTPNIPANYLPISYNWDFGDGTTDTSPLAIHTYNTAGVYYVCLTVSMYNPNLVIINCTFCDSITVGNANQNLCNNVNFTNTVNGLTANFVSNVPAGIYSPTYSWTFGDGSVSTLANPTHTYSQSGTYYVCMSVSGYDIQQQPITCFYCDSVTVTNANQNLCNNVSFTKTTNGLTANFVSNVPAGIYSPTYSWTFGDGSISTLANPTHTYSQSGMYYVCMSVSGYDIQQQPITCVYCDSVTVLNANQNVCDSLNFTTTINGLTANFISNIPAGIYSPTYNWTFGDGSNSTLANPSHTYNQTGFYYVCLSVNGYNIQQQPITCTKCDSVMVMSSSVSSVSNNLKLNVYPNPTKGDVEIELPGKEMFELKLYDVTGKIIFSDQINSNKNLYNLNINHLSRGSYHILLQSTEGRKYHASLIKQ
ncbi:MAG TPA: PKD domain-containing protein [Chitinophagaceae bacterium]|nr:MAG: PKD domain-containing protein [Bacteroidetes bacterium OLB11]HMN32425.1 PKD domain-containing protein [Chitinophagaceae bacterium]